MLKAYAKTVTVIVPFFAKSAASLIAIGADKLMMCRAGELGPIDPQVRDPQSGHFIPAHSIKEAVTFIEETKDMLVKLSLSNKISVLLIGAYREAGTSAKQYLEDVLAKRYEETEDKIIEAFTERFLSHGYPIDRNFLENIGIKITHPSEEIERLLCDLHRKFKDIIFRLYENDRNLEGKLLIIQTEKILSVSIGSRDITESLNVPDSAGSLGNESVNHAPDADLKKPED